MHRGIHLIIYSLVRSIVLLLVGSFVVRTKYFPTRSLTFSSLFSLKGQGDGEQPNQPGAEDNGQHGGEGGKSLPVFLEIP